MYACAYHENVNLLLDAVHKHVKDGVYSNLKTFTSALVCDEPNGVYMTSHCKKCSKYFKAEVQEKVIEATVKIKQLQWNNNHRQAEKRESEETVVSCVECLSNSVKQYLLHVFIKHTQCYLFEQLKESTDNRKVLVQADYAENFAMDHQDAIQSVHWNTKILSISTADVCCGVNNFSFALVFDNINHDKYYVHMSELYHS